MEAQASALLGQRLRRRERAARLVAEGAFTRVGGVAMAVLSEETDGELFPGLLPDARVVMLALPGTAPGTWRVKLRLGAAAPDGLSLAALGIEQFDPRYGGRWNAGSDRRGGGTTIAPGVYAGQVAERLDRALGALDGHA